MRAQEGQISRLALTSDHYNQLVRANCDQLVLAVNLWILKRF